MTMKRRGRPPKTGNLFQDNGRNLSSVRKEEPDPEGPVLPETLPEPAQAAGGRRLFGAAPDSDGSGGGGGQQPPVPNNASPFQDPDQSVSAILKRVMTEPAAPEFQKTEDRMMTNAELLARSLIYDALKGDRDAREKVLDRLEGKPIRGQPVFAPDTSLEEQIDRLGVAALNDLAEGEDGT